MSTIPLDPNDVSELELFDVGITTANAINDAELFFPNSIGGGCFFCDLVPNNLGPGGNFVPQIEDDDATAQQQDYQGNLQAISLPGLGDTYLDEDFSNNIQTFIDETSANGVTLHFNSAYRTPEYQNSLQGDPTAITPATTSLHSAGLAVDVNYASLGNTPGGLTGDEKRQVILDAAETAALSWGGLFTSPDVPHFYIDPGTDRTILINNATESLENLEP